MTRLMEVGGAATIDLPQPQPQVASVHTAVPAPSKAAFQAMNLLIMAVKTISQRALIAATNLVTLIGLGTAFWLWLAVMERTDGPTTSQLIGLGLYGLLLVGLRWVWRLA